MDLKNADRGHGNLPEEFSNPLVSIDLVLIVGCQVSLGLGF